jgi:hypothetical protein
MKYLLTLQLDPALIEGMTEDEQNAAFVVGHEKFQKTLTESGEFVGTKALAFPADTVTVRVPGGVAQTSGGLFADHRFDFPVRLLPRRLSQQGARDRGCRTGPRGSLHRHRGPRDRLRTRRRVTGWVRLHYGTERYDRAMSVHAWKSSGP